jgi:hypothetical protein
MERTPTNANGNANNGASNALQKVQEEGIFAL